MAERYKLAFRSHMKKKTVSLAFVLTLLVFLMLVASARATVVPLQQEVVTTITLDKVPKCIAVNEETNRIYVGAEGCLLIIDSETDTVIAEILPDVEVVALAVNPQTNRIYVADYGDNIFVIDGATNQQVGVIPEGIYQQYELAVNPTTNLVYIADWTTILGYYDKILVYSGETFTEVTRVNIPGSDEHTIIERIGLAVNPETNLVYATWSGNNHLYVIDGDTHEILGNVSPSSFSREITVNTYTNYIYVGGTVMDCDTLVEVFSDYEGTLEAVDSVNNLVYTVGYSGGNYNLYVLTGTTHDIVTSLELDWSFSSYSDCVGVNCETDKVYLVDNSENQIPVVLIPEFHALISTMLVLFVLAVAFFIYTRTVSEEPIHKQSSIH
jgi:DNA-binding beta-propeller fold protein YncE